MTSKPIACLLAGAALFGTARAADLVPVHITVLADLDDDLYNARSGMGGGAATRMAGADCGGTVLGGPVVVDAVNDHNRAAEAPGLAAQAYDAGADLLMDVQNSPIAAAVSKVATARHKLAISTGSANPGLTRAACSRYFYHYSFDLPSIATATATYLASLPGNRRWAMVAEDTGFGKGVAAVMSPVVAAHGAEVVKSIVVPASTTDFSPALAEVRDASPDVVAVFSDGAKGDDGVADVTRAALKATTTTGLLYLSDVDRVKDGYAGVVAAVPWYWNLDLGGPLRGEPRWPPPHRGPGGRLFGDDAMVDRGPRGRHHGRGCRDARPRRAQIRRHVRARRRVPGQRSHGGARPLRRSGQAIRAIDRAACLVRGPGDGSRRDRVPRGTGLQDAGLMPPVRSRPIRRRPPSAAPTPRSRAGHPAKSVRSLRDADFSFCSNAARAGDPLPGRPLAPIGSSHRRAPCPDRAPA